MGGVRRFWLRWSATAVCALALLLPYRPRVFLARFLAYLSNPGNSTIGLAFQRQARLWNRAVLALVFFLGFPLAKVLLLLTSRGRLAPPAGAATFWASRLPAEQFDRNVREPF